MINFINIVLIKVVNAAGLGQPPDIGVSKTPLPAMILQLVNYALGLVGVLALGFIVFGGFLYITAHGEAQQIEKAKGIIIYSVIGIIVIGVAAALVTFVVGAMTGSGG